MNPTSVQQINEWRAAKSETVHLEFKEARNQFDYDDLLRYCVAIGNEGGGVLLLGIKDKPPRQVVGTSTYRNINKITEQLLNKLRFRVDVEEVNHPDGRVVVFHIPSRPSQHPVSVDGAYYMRSGESLVAMTPEQLKKIFSEPSAERNGTSAPNSNKRQLGVALLILACVAAIGVIGYRFSRLTPNLQSDSRSAKGDLGNSGSTTTPTTEPEKSKSDKTGPSGPKLTGPRAKSPSTESAKTAESKPSNTQPPNKLRPDNSQGNPAQQPSGGQPPLTKPQTFRERVVQKNKNSPAGDRERLANAFYDFSESLEEGRTLMYKGFNEAAAIGAEGAGIAKDLQTHIVKLRELTASAKEYGKSNAALRTKWDYYREQTQYVFEDNPDNLGWGKLANAFDSYANHLETWGVIQNKDDQRVLNILAEDRTQFEAMLTEFSSFYQGCKTRLEEMKASIQ